jgi:hypothetical protein
MERAIGSGGMGTVWLATDTLLDRPVAIKRLRAEITEDDEARQRILREARIAARLHDPRIVTLFDVLSVAGVPWLVMEYLPAQSLAELLERQGQLAPRAAAGIGATVAEALDVAHRAGITHRDVKPANVLIGANFVVKLTDFGIAHSTTDATITAANVLTGTPAYFAPEVAAGDDPSPAADVWALGATLYAAVEGRPPFGKPDGNILRFLRRVASQPVPPPRAAGSLTPVIMHLLERNPAARPSPAQAAAALRAVADGAPVLPAPPTRTLDRAPRRGRVALVAGTVVAGLAITLLAREVLPAASGAAAPSSPAVEQVGLGEDPRSADPCSLLDVGPFAQFGSVGVYSDFGELNTCRATVAPATDSFGELATVKVSLLAPPVPGAGMLGDVSNDGPYLVSREAAPSEGSCTRTIALRDNHRVYIEAIGGDTQVDMCALAEAATRGALVRLQRSGVAPRNRPPTPAAPNSLADVDTCQLVAAADVNSAGLTAAPRPELGRWSCRWVADGIQLDVLVDRTLPLSAGTDGTLSSVAGRTFYTRPKGDGDQTDRCVVVTPQRSFTAADGGWRWETLQVTLRRSDIAEDARCAAATALMTAAVARLPAPTPP